jgi:tetratricopeptide (TPR) repeat protein
VAKILKVANGGMVFARIWHIVARKRRPSTSVQMFRRAQHLRDEARYKRAALVVEDALLQDPRSVVGHLLAASLHMVLRETGQARASFERVLALEPTQPRALLGLARVALEEGDAAACLELLTRALTRYPDFQEARALLEVARGLVTTADAKRTAASNGAIHANPLRLPAESLEALFMRADATVLFAEPHGPRTNAVAGSAMKLATVATAMLEGAGLGPLRHAVIEGVADTTYLRADDAALLTVSFDRDLKSATAVEHLKRVWDRCRSELA